MVFNLRFRFFTEPSSPTWFSSTMTTAWSSAVETRSESWERSSKTSTQSSSARTARSASRTWWTTWSRCPCSLLTISSGMMWFYRLRRQAWPPSTSWWPTRKRRKLGWGNSWCSMMRFSGKAKDIKQVDCSKYLFEWNMVNGHRYILPFNDNEQLLILEQKAHKVKERARPYLQRCLVNVTRPDKWSHNSQLMFWINL